MQIIVVAIKSIHNSIVFILVLAFGQSCTVQGGFNDLLAKAKAGDPIAQFRLGVMYDQGEGIPQDFKQALFWISKSADQGFSYAQTNLGWMYRTGQSIPQDDQKAAHWYSLAAKQGDAG